MSAQKILVVDDEFNVLDTIRVYLERSGFQVLTASTGREAMQVQQEEGPDLMVLDLLMPEMDGWEVIRLTRYHSDIPIVVLTANVEDENKIVTLETGVDDYITKPFNPREVVARVRAVLRRTQRQVPEEPTILKVGDLWLDTASHEAGQDDARLKLTRAEFDLLACLMSQPGRVFTRSELLGSLYGDETYVVYERTVDVHIKNLRVKLGDDPAAPHYIETVYGVGYRMIRNA